MESVLITGGSGLIGRHLAGMLHDKGYTVSVLSRTDSRRSGIQTFLWNPFKGTIDREALEKTDYIIHLAGAGIGDKKWTTKRKQEIIDSRVKTAELIHKSALESGIKIKAFITISGINYYGTLTAEKIFTEDDPPADDFLGETCRLWEEAADAFSGPETRVVKIRTGIVLSGEGGVLARLMTPVRFGIGSPIGHGNQFVPWIHIDDLCGIFIKAIEDHSLSGAYNAAAPEMLTNRELMRKLADVLVKPYFFPAIPSFLMKLIFGEMAGILLEGSRVSVNKIISAGFRFRFPDLVNALKDLLLRDSVSRT